jgi:hypothetical protein
LEEPHAMAGERRGRRQGSLKCLGSHEKAQPGKGTAMTDNT